MCTECISTDQMQLTARYAIQLLQEIDKEKKNDFSKRNLTRVCFEKKEENLFNSILLQIVHFILFDKTFCIFRKCFLSFSLSEAK